jgi:hypothetical protein
MDWDNPQICHWLTAMGLGEYVEVFRGMFVKLGIRGKESSAFGSFAFNKSGMWCFSTKGFSRKKYLGGSELRQ